MIRTILWTTSKNFFGFSLYWQGQTISISFTIFLLLNQSSLLWMMEWLILNFIFFRIRIMGFLNWHILIIVVVLIVIGFMLSWPIITAAITFLQAFCWILWNFIWLVLSSRHIEISSSVHHRQNIFICWRLLHYNSWAISID